MKEEALKLADCLCFIPIPKKYKQTQLEASVMIRRLVEELDKPHKYNPETGEPLIDGYPLFSGLPRGKPLSDEEIVSLYESSYWQVSGHFDEWEFDPVYFARAIEKEHGIK